MEDKAANKHGVQISDKKGSIKYIESNTDVDEDLVRGKRHSSEDFIRLQADSEDQWNRKYHYVLCCILKGIGHDVFPVTMKLAVQLSGGSLMLLLLTFSLIIGLPMIYMETFLGRYTKLTNCQMYRMVPIFFGFCLFLFALNVFMQPLHAATAAQLLVNLLKLLANPQINTKCLDDNKECYDYKKKGKLNDTCKYGHISMICEKHGEIRYLMEYQYWKTYKDPSSDTFPYNQIVTAVVITWIIILVIVMKKLQVLGWIINVAFITQMVVLTMIFLLALFKEGGTDGLNVLVNVNLDKLDFFQVLTVQWYSLCRLGLIIPTGFMTFSAYGGFGHDIGSECFIIVICSILLVGYYLAIFFTICGVLAKAMGVAVEAVIIPDKGLFSAVVPQFLVELEMPNAFLVFYYGCIWYSETVRIAFYVHMLILNLYDYFPTLKNFPSYIWVTSSLLLCLLSIPASGKFTNTVFIPTLWAIYVMLCLGISLSLQVTMVSYFYGVGRLCNDIYFLTGHKPMRFLRCMWYLIPFIGWAGIFFTLTKMEAKFLEDNTNIKKDNQKDIEEGWLYGSLTAMGGGCICIFSTIMYIAFRFGNPNLLVKLLKPQYFWGPSDRAIRVERKHFYPNISIRSQQFRSRMKTENEYFDTIHHGVLLSEFSRDVLTEQAGRGDILSDKLFFQNIGFVSHVTSHVKRTSFSKEKRRELDDKDAT